MHNWCESLRSNPPSLLPPRRPRAPTQSPRFFFISPSNYHLKRVHFPIKSERHTISGPGHELVSSEAACEQAYEKRWEAAGGCRGAASDHPQRHTT